MGCRRIWKTVSSDRPSPLQVPAIGPVERAKPQADVVADQVVEDPPDGADLVVLVEDQTDDLADLLVGVHLDPIRRELDVAQWARGERARRAGPCAAGLAPIDFS